MTGSPRWGNFIGLGWLIHSFHDMILSLHNGVITLSQFSNDLKEMIKLLNQISIYDNKIISHVIKDLSMTKENLNLVSKYKLINKLFMGVKLNDSKLESLDILKQNLKMSNKFLNSMYMLLHLNDKEDIIIDKVERNLLRNIGYSQEELKDCDLLKLIPKKIAKYHKQKTTNFTKSNRDYRALDIFFITKDALAVPVVLNCLIIPTFENQIIFFALFEPPKNTPIDASMKMSITIFLHLSANGRIVTFNKETTDYLGISMEMIETDSAKFNFLTKILKISPDNIFSPNLELQKHSFNISYGEIIKNLKTLNLEDFRERAYESYLKFNQFLASGKTHLLSRINFIVNIERRIIDPIDQEFYYTITFIYDNSELNRRNYFFEETFTPTRTKASNTIQSKDKKLKIISNEIYRMSMEMLKEGSRLWKGLVKYSDIANPNINRISNKKNLQTKNFLDKLILDEEFGSTFLRKKLNSKHSFSKFLIFFFLMLSLGFFFTFFCQEVFKKIETSLEFFEISQNILKLKFSQTMITFKFMEVYLYKQGLTKYEKNSTEIKNEMEYYLDLMNDNLFQLQKRLIFLDSRFNKSNLMELIYMKKNYSLLFEDHSIYRQEMSLEDVILFYRSKVANLNGSFPFQNFISQNNLNNNNFKTLASHSDYMLHFILNNFIENLNPLYDSILQEEKDRITMYSSEIINYEIINLSLTDSILLILIIYFYVCFSLGKKSIFNKYFYNFNILKYFTPYIIRKLECVETLLIDYNKENLATLSKLDFELSGDNISNSLIRFELEHNNLIILPLERSDSSKKFERISTKFYNIKSLLNSVNKKTNFSSENLDKFKNGIFNRKDLNNLISSNKQVNMGQNTKTHSNTQNSVGNTQTNFNTNNFLITSNELNEDDSFIYPKNLLVGKASFYLDFYFIFIMVVIFMALNFIFFLLFFYFVKNIIFFNNFTQSLISVSNSQFEISLIYLIKGLNKNSDPNYLKMKIDDYFSHKENIVTSINSYRNTKYMQDLFYYQSQMFSQDSCSFIINFDILNLNNSLKNNTCSSEINSLFKNGLYLGFDTMVNNIEYNFNEKINSASYSMKDDNLDLLFQNSKPLIEKNVFNNFEIIFSYTNSNISQFSLYKLVYLIAFYSIFFTLFFSYCIMSFFTERTFSLISKSEETIFNFLK